MNELSTGVQQAGLIKREVRFPVARARAPRPARSRRVMR